MKTSIFRLLSAGTLALATLGLAESCKDDDDLGLFSAHFYPTRPQGIQLYADQTVDSTHVVSTVSWNITSKAVAGEGGWLRFSPEKASVPSHSQLTQRVRIEAEANKTGYPRASEIDVNLQSDRIDGIVMPVIQYGWLNITVPQPAFAEEELAKMQPTFEHSLKATDLNAPMVCRLYAPATIESDAEWLTVPEGRKNVEAGVQNAIFSVERNDTGAERTAHVTVTSVYGCSSVITYKQRAQ